MFSEITWFLVNYFKCLFTSVFTILTRMIHLHTSAIRKVRRCTYFGVVVSSILFLQFLSVLFDFFSFFSFFFNFSPCLIIFCFSCFCSHCCLQLKCFFSTCWSATYLSRFNKIPVHQKCLFDYPIQK